MLPATWQGLSHPSASTARGGTIMIMTKPIYVRFFEEFDIGDVPLVGGKTASLGEMYQKLSSEGVRVPNGFAITAEAYRYMLEEAGVLEPLHAALGAASEVGDIARRAKRARELVY